MTAGEMIEVLKKYPKDMKVMMEYHDHDKTFNYVDLLEIDELIHEKGGKTEYLLAWPKFEK